MTDQRTLRQQLRQQRAALTFVEQQHLSQQICEHIARSHIYKRSRKIAIYLAHGREVDLGPLLTHAWSARKQVFVPALGLRGPGKLWFVPLTAHSHFYRNRFGIHEPAHSKRDRRRLLRSLDVLFIPLLGYDKHGTRLGMGGGFYDKTLASVHSANAHWQRPKRIGIAYSFQEIPQLQRQPWDIPLHAIVTEQGLHEFTRKTT